MATVILMHTLGEITELKTDGFLASDRIAREQAAIDAAWFVTQLAANIKAPIVSGATDGEIALTWRQGQFRAVISFEGDHRFGYALYKNGTFMPGKHEGKTNSPFPRDLEEYLARFTKESGG